MRRRCRKVNQVKILVDAHMVGESETGNERYIVQLINALGSLKVDCNILVAVSRLPEAEDVIEFGARVQPVQVSSSPARRLMIDLPALVRKEHVDLLHVTYMGPLRKCCPMVVTIHDVSWRANRSWFSPRDFIVLTAGTAVTAKRAKRIITPSRHAKGEISRFLGISPENISVTPEAAAPHFVPLSPKALEDYPFGQWSIQRPYILAVGNLQPRKNLLRLVEAFARVIGSRHMPHRLVLAGQTRWRGSEVHAAVRRLGIEDRIVFTGYVPDKDLVHLLGGADLFVYPSLYEGFGLPVLEAMACGTPVVTSNCTSIPEVTGDAALLIDPYSVDELAKAIDRVLCDELLRANLKKKSLARAQVFSWRKTAILTWAVYCKATGANPPDMTEQENNSADLP